MIALFLSTTHSAKENKVEEQTSEAVHTMVEMVVDMEMEDGGREMDGGHPARAQMGTLHGGFEGDGDEDKIGAALGAV